MTDLVNVTLPADQAEGTESVVAKWFKAVGEVVNLDEPLLEISTDKVSVEIAAPTAGVLREILHGEGDPVEPGAVLGRIETGGGGGGGGGGGRAATAGAAAGAEGRRAESAAPAPPELSPAVRRLIAEHDLNPARIAGTGRGGRITVEDVERHLAGSAAPPPSPGEALPGRRVPHSPMRQRIARHMVESVHLAPHVTTVFEADLTAVLADRERRRAAGAAGAAGGADQAALPTLTAYFARATVEAIRAVPETNARWHDDALEIWEDINLGIATAVPDGGLIVPVLRQAQNLDLVETGRRVRDLAERARSGTLAPEEVRGGTFTISNHGVSGSLLAAPIIIHQPQSAILGVGNLQQRVVAVKREGGRFEATVKPMVYVTLTIDHRVLDGYAANRFLTRFVEALETWPS